MLEEEVVAPEGWKVEMLSSCVDVLDSRRKPVNSKERATRPGSVPYYGATGQVGWIDDFLFDEELVLLGEDGAPFLDKSKPIAYVIAGKSWVNNHAHVLRARKDVTSNRYIKHYLDSFDFKHRVQGSTRDKLTQGSMNSIPVLLAPRRVQDALVATIDAVSSLRGRASDHLAVARRAAERFRQAVLAAACSGRLTADWREFNDEAVSDELQSTIDAAVADERVLPESWRMARVRDIGVVQLGGTPSRKRADYWDGSVSWVSSGEVANCRISSTRETISEEGLTHSSAKLYPPGTVLIAMIGEGKTRGQAAILDIEASTNQNAAGILADRRFIHPEYLWRWALSEYETTRAAGMGGNQPALNKQRIGDLVVPIPPLGEQGEIVRRVDHLLPLADGLKKRIDTASNRVDRSAQAVLAKAFRGELLNGGAA